MKTIIYRRVFVSRFHERLFKSGICLILYIYTYMCIFCIYIYIHLYVFLVSLYFFIKIYIYVYNIFFYLYIYDWY